MDEEHGGYSMGCVLAQDLKGARSTSAHILLNRTTAEAGKYILAMCPVEGKGNKFCDKLGKFCLGCQVCAL